MVSAVFHSPQRASQLLREAKAVAAASATLSQALPGAATHSAPAPRPQLPPSARLRYSKISITL